MRVVRTEMYFEPSQIRDLNTKAPGSDNPGIAFAWFKGPQQGDDPASLGNVGWLQNVQMVQSEEIDFMIDLLLRHDRMSIALGLPFPHNRDIINYIFGQDIILEHSPPFAISLKGLVDSTNLPIIVGSYLGWDAAQAHPILLFITIPSGIIAVSSAIGIGKALQDGLNKRIGEFFSTKKGSSSPAAGA